VRRLLAGLAAAVAVAAAAPGSALAAAPLSLVRIGSANGPDNVVAAPGDGDRLFVVERTGRIVVLKGGVQSVFVDLTSRVHATGYEQGLFGLAFAPDYADSGKFYVYYNAPAAGPTSNNGSDVVVSELRRTDADHADASSERVLLRITHRLEQYENGGGLLFAPDGKLWIGTGDGGGWFDPHNNAQRLDPATDNADADQDALLGKLLRIDPAPGDGCGGQCTIPADNPGFAQREVWAYGLRNPWRFAFDPVTGQLAIGDVGNETYEEVDAALGPQPARGINFGWPFFEGNHPGQGAPPAGCCTPPVIERSHAEGFDALIGGVFVRDPAVPALAGRYLYAALTNGHIRSAVLQGGTPVTDDADTGLTLPGITSFGTDACGHVLMASLDGGIYRLVQGAATGCGALGARLTAAAHQRGWRSDGRLRAHAACAAACTVTLTASFTGVRGVRAKSAHAALAADSGATLTLRLGGSARRAVAAALRRGRRPSVRFTATARSATGRPGFERAEATSRLTGVARKR
jgi:glucose/arabinose dehydrogenase